ncbi:hypothetical protein DPMN_118169 [Dreissena polymorpha]|uniref:BLOC-1-related complex subunit 6 C-terminal helix domain-containing protein n=1 Tax=Dreissena polymorpha TaxID=45954 RepID=A0A9D4JN96_DREPO|nr:hypothetical protein DPMN_118169 [Dreissena polymorpha]
MEINASSGPVADSNDSNSKGPLSGLKNYGKADNSTHPGMKDIHPEDIHSNPDVHITAGNASHAGIKAESNVSTVNDSMLESHGESGYLTDSMISGYEKTTLGSDTSSKSEADITPCGENLMVFSDSSSNNSLISPEKTIGDAQEGSLAESSSSTYTNSESDKLDRFGQMAIMASIGINDIESLDKIISSNSIPARPESLTFTNNDNGDSGIAKTRSYNDYGDSPSMSNSEGRKRSKSSAFPIPRLKEGVHISEELLSKSLPHGKVIQLQTGMIEFIADDLIEKIKMSSPMSKTASEVSSSRRSSDLSITSMDSMASSSLATSMTSGRSRSSYPQSPDCMPPIDPIAVHEIENHARMVAENVDQMMTNLRENLHKMSAISVGCEEAYKTSVDFTCDSVDSSIKSMYALMAKCEELSKSMQPVYKLNDQMYPCFQP